MLRVSTEIDDKLCDTGINYNHRPEYDDEFIWIETDEPEKVAEVLGMDLYQDYIKDVEVHIYEATPL